MALRRVVRALPRHGVATRHAAAPPRSGRSGASSPGGWTTTRCFARCTRAHDERPWTDWPEPLRDRGARRRRRGARRAGRRHPVPPVPAVGGRRSVGRARAAMPATSRCLAICRSWSSGDSADVWARQDEFRLDASVGVPPDAFSDDRPGLGAAGLPVGRARRTRLRLAARSRAPERRSVRRLSRRSPRRLLSHLLPAASTAARRSSRHPTKPSQQRARRARAGGLPRAGRGDHRGGSRCRPRLRPRVAGAARRPRLQGVPLGAATGTTPGQPFKDPLDYPPVVGRDVRDARHRADGRSGGRGAPHEERQAVLAIPSVASRLTDEDRARALEARAAVATRSAKRCSRRSLRRAPTC